ncbi:hypothetical protein [Photobacterium nomapromontoriensis]|uniref:hypothetical protein n=1 Tax=Photobacterium nomapromontoriensis TaxID=2910237 RepID=UPI003D095C48
MRSHRCLLSSVLLVGSLLPIASWATCDPSANAQVNLVYVEDFAAGANAGQIVKQKVDYLRGIMSSSAFESIHSIQSSVSLYTESENDNKLVISLSSQYAGSFEAMTQLVNSKHHISIDISQCN